MAGIKVVILCGGMGVRLKEETEFRPKPMIEIGGKPILWHIMKIYDHYGFNDFVLCLGYKGEMIKEFFYKYETLNNDFTIELGKPHQPITYSHSHNETNWRVTLVDTGLSTLKGGRIKRIEKFIDSDCFMLTYGDGVAQIDLRRLLEFHRSHGKTGTVTGVYPPSRFGEISIEGERVVSFEEKPQLSKGIINGGFFVFNRTLFDYLTPQEDCDFEHGPLQRLAQEGELMVYHHKGFWECMDTLRDYEHLKRLWETNKAAWRVW